MVLVPGSARAADPVTPAQFTVTTNIAKAVDKVPPLGVNGWGGCGAVEWAANNFVHNSGNEPIYWRNLHRAKACGPNWFEIDGPGTSWWDLWNSGFLSGADLRIYRLVDKDGRSLPPKPDGTPDAANADHVVFVGKGRVIPEGDKEFADGGWVANTYADVYPNASIRHGNLTATDLNGVENGRTYWYAVVAVNASNQESIVTNEVSVTPTAGAETRPHLLVASGDDKLPNVPPGKDFELKPKVAGGRPPYKWSVVNVQGEAASLPAGLVLDSVTGRVFGKAEEPVENLAVTLRVVDTAGHGDRRTWVLNPVAPGSAAGNGRPEPPSQVTGVGGDGCVTLSWKPSPSPDVVAYRLKRSTAPAARQLQRVFVTPDTPPLERWDYIVIARRFDSFDMRYVNPRVRGMGNPTDAPNWYWRTDEGSAVSFALVPHPKPVPAGLLDPGETCMRVQAGPGEQSFQQYTFIGTGHGGESQWYGQLEPGRNYGMDVWLRQEGLAADGAVTFSLGNGYPELTQTFKVTSEWKRYGFRFIGPDRPVKPMHFGPKFALRGPGTLWMDNCRMFRCDRPEDADRPYVPNATVLKELVETQPLAGLRGAHRNFFLNRDATLSSLTSWHANSRVNVDWATGVGPTVEMTLPMGLTFDLATGTDAASRMRPWLTLQHVLHSEEDWLGLIEYLAAPYDPATDTPQSKPWAYKRYQQRGVGTPWTDEFTGIIIEFGNETWHNGVFADWLGFATRNAVHQGGKEYGLFTRYLCETIMKSPYWKAQKLDGRIRFALGGNYDARIDKDGSVRGYGEEAMQANPYATLLGHANYVGPKWETGDYSARQYDDHGVQQCLLSFLEGAEAGEVRMGESREVLAKAGRTYDMAAYEGGPGGYALPGGGVDPRQVETNEKYGKSLAQAVGAFDGWMRSYRLGWTDQCFFSYGQGSHWNSHTVFAEGFRPCPAWLAMTLRNRCAAGDLMTVEEASVPVLERGKKAYPLVGAYAFRQGDAWSVFCVSRKLNGAHDGQDFGDGYTPVTLRLPFVRARQITLHKLSADPRKTNREAMNVAIEAMDLPAEALARGAFAVNERSGGGAGGLPPGSIFCYEFTGVQ